MAMSYMAIISFPVDDEDEGDESDTLSHPVSARGAPQG